MSYQFKVGYVMLGQWQTPRNPERDGIHLKKSITGFLAQPNQIEAARESFHWKLKKISSHHCFWWTCPCFFRECFIFWGNSKTRWFQTCWFYFYFTWGWNCKGVWLLHVFRLGVSWNQHLKKWLPALHFIVRSKRFVGEFFLRKTQPASWWN